MQDALKSVWSISYVSVAFFPSLKQNFIAYPSSKVSSRPDCIFEIHQQWQSGFSRVYSNYCYSCSFEPKIIKICQSSHNMYSNYILNFQKSTTILNACTKKSVNLSYAPRICIHPLSTWARCDIRSIFNGFFSRLFVYPRASNQNFLLITEGRIIRLIHVIGGARGVMVIVVGIGHDNTSSNLGWDWMHFT